MMTTKRLNFFELSPKAMAILLDQEELLQQQFSDSSLLNTTIWELVKLRISQINQCAYCIDMHSKDALHQGEKAERIFGLSAWRDTPLYSEQEKNALAWAELVTANQAISDDAYQQALAAFGEKGLVDMTIAVNAINSWNRLAKIFKPEVGPYKAN